MSIIGNVDSNSIVDGSQSQQAKSKLDDDLNQFLNLLVAQLQNQDPLDPLDANEFTSQLVQFASVEQQIFQNSNLEKLLNLQETGQISQMVDFIGNRIEFTSQKMPVENGSAEFTYTIPPGVRDATINIANSAGLNVYFQDAETNAGTHNFTWNGLDKNGNQVPDGIYTLLISAKDAFDKLAPVDYTVYGTVTGAGVDNGETELFVGDDLGVNVEDIMSVKKPITTN
ncbi:MAG: flagellar hook assembly protein FlgD [Rhodospirillaceae bacterium]|jgi:flagellar basal-body rod modification protein FlgD|nr:flagellar hook assembly protein FlgD [Rhodospirillaceae bacterium]